jgi:hypothetical protein
VRTRSIIVGRWSCECYLDQLDEFGAILILWIFWKLEDGTDLSAKLTIYSGIGIVKVLMKNSESDSNNLHSRGTLSRNKIYLGAVNLRFELEPVYIITSLDS